jgi:hypothetical protein
MITALSVAQFSLVSLTGVSEFMLQPAQTEMLARAGQKVARHFPSVLTDKQQDIIGFIGALGSIAFIQTKTYLARKMAQNQARQ